MVSWICLILQLPYGLGHHGLTIPVDRRTKFEQISFWKTVISDGFAMGLLRISMALSLLRLNKDTKWYRWSLFAVIGNMLIIMDGTHGILIVFHRIRGFIHNTSRRLAVCVL